MYMKILFQFYYKSIIVSNVKRVRACVFVCVLQTNIKSLKVPQKKTKNIQNIQNSKLWNQKK